MIKQIAVLLACSVILLAIPSTPLQAIEPSGEAESKLPWDDVTVRTRIAPALLKEITAAPSSVHWPIIILMRHQAPLHSVIERAALVDTLRATAILSQRDVRTFLADEQQAGRVDAIRPFWIFNGLAARAAPQTIYALASRDDVELIQRDEFRLRISASAFRPSLLTDGIEWGVQRVQADRVWTSFNITGTDVVVANMDTGVDYQHPALNGNYRGNLGKNLYQHTGNWFDATGAGALYPVDGHSHGTHTMGTLAGQDGIGVAPGAHWIAARVLDNRGYGTTSWIHAGFEWMLAPNGDPALAPDVLNNSWGSSSGGSTEFWADVLRLRQAGILVTFSAGNNGPGAETIGSPASLPGAFAVGATDVDNEVTTFSGRGPTLWGELKPQVAAPGVNVRSSTPGGAYALLDGTSMAAPHVAGVAALMLAANPSLSVTTTESLLMSTAISISAITPNNQSGWGLVNAYAAVQAASGAGTLSGRVVDASSRLPLSGATVTMRNYETGQSLSVQSGGDGQYSTGLAAGHYYATAALFGYAPDSVSHLLVITGQATIAADLMPAPLPLGVLRGVLTDTLTGQPATATVSISGTPLSRVFYGVYSFDVPAGAYTLQARGVGYRVVTATAVVTTNHVTWRNLGLIPTQRILLVNSGAWYYHEYPDYFRQALDELHYAYDEIRIKHPIGDSPTITDLLKYDVVIWSSPEDSPGYVGADEVIAQFLSNGGGLILTGQDVALWDGGGTARFYTPYMQNYLKTSYVSDNAQTRQVTGLPDSLMTGLSFDIEGGDGADNQSWPDVIAVTDADYASQILRYAGNGSAGNKVGLCLPYRAVVFPFGYEAISDAESRRQVMQRTLDYFTSPRLAEGLSLVATSPQTQVDIPGTVVTFTMRARNTGEASVLAAYTTTLQSAGWTAVISPTRFELSRCASALLTVQVNIPPDLGLDVRNALTLTVRSVMTPTLAQTISFAAKTPAPVLLVDDGRWYNTNNAYIQAMDQVGVTYDVWQVPRTGSITMLNGPPFERLKWYPITAWFTGYDWSIPLSAYDEEQLAAYLDSGGRLMLSSVFYLDARHNSNFARQRLGVMNYTYGMTATHSYGSPEHPLGAGFERMELVDPFPRASYFTLDYALVPSAEAETAWRGDRHRAQAIARSQPGNRLVFWGIPFEALPDDARARVMQRTIGWLGPLGDSSVQVKPPVISTGQPATVTLTVRNNLLDTNASFTATLPIGIIPDLATLPPGVSYYPTLNTLAWNGAIASGAAQSFTFRVKTNGAYGTLQPPGSVVFRDQVLGFEFDQPLAVRVEAPDLHGDQDACRSEIYAEPALPLKSTAVKMRVCNSGPGVASSAVISSLAPLHLKIISGTVTLDGPGEVQPQTSGLTWRGTLSSEQSITITYRVIAPFVTYGNHLPVEMLAWDGYGGAWEWRAWMDIWQSRVYLPMVLK